MYVLNEAVMMSQKQGEPKLKLLALTGKFKLGSFSLQEKVYIFYTYILYLTFYGCGLKVN